MGIKYEAYKTYVDCGFVLTTAFKLASVLAAV